jgi:hypothetical protein
MSSNNTITPIITALRVTEADSPMRNAMLVSPASSVQLRGSLSRQEGIPPTQFGRTVARIATGCGPPQPVASRRLRASVKNPRAAVLRNAT